MNCDRLARWYRWLEYVGLGRALESRRSAFLPDLTDARRVLMLGEGDGRFLAAFLEANADAKVDCVDLSPQMLSLAAQRTHDKSDRVRFHHADARDWPMPAGASYDLIVTHFFLDCFADDELLPLVRRFAAAAAPNALWIVSEFHQPAHGFDAWRARLWIGGLYAFFRLSTGLRARRLPDHHACLRGCGFRCERVVTAGRKLLVSELWRQFQPSVF